MQTLSLRSLALTLSLLVVPPLPLLPALPVSATSETTTEATVTSMTGHPACQPSTEIGALLESLDERLPVDCSEDPRCHTEELAALRDLLREHPDSLFLHRRLQDSILFGPGAGTAAYEKEVEKLLASYAQRSRERPDDAAAHYLYARLLQGTKLREKRQAAYRRSLEVDPRFPWTLLDLTRQELLDDPGTRLEAPQSFQNFARLCPRQAVEILSFQRTIQDEDFWRPRLRSLREVLMQDSEGRQLAAFPNLWVLEFRLTPLAEHDRLRSQVLKDIERLRAFQRTDDGKWWKTLQEGYQTVGDIAGEVQLAEEARKLAPCLGWTVREVQEYWRDRLSEAKGTADATTVLVELWKATETLLARCPEELGYSDLRLRAAGRRPELSDEELIAEIDRHLTLWQSHSKDPAGSHPPWGEVAQLLLDRGLQPQRARELAAKAVEEARNPEVSKVDRLMPDAYRIQTRQGELLEEINGLALLARAHFAADDPEGVQETMAAIDAKVAELEAHETEHADVLLLTLHDRVTQAGLTALGKQARIEGETADAFAFYLKAMRLQPGDETLTQRVEDLWAELGGSPLGWKAMETSPTGRPLTATASPGGWRERNEPLPEMELSDLQGRTWNKADLQGKAILVNAWATWCAPCRLELPYVQKLHERLGSEPEMAVLTFNSDSSIGVVEPFLKSHGYDFPVLLATDVLLKKLEAPSIPQTWIIDPTGTVRYQSSGFDVSKAKTWVEDMVARLAEVSAEVRGNRP